MLVPEIVRESPVPVEMEFRDDALVLKPANPRHGPASRVFEGDSDDWGMGDQEGARGELYLCTVLKEAYGFIADITEDFENESWFQCRTDHSPFDIVVTAVLATLEHCAPFAIKAESDGKASDCEAGAELTRMALCDYSIRAPMEVRPSDDEPDYWRELDLVWERLKARKHERYHGRLEECSLLLSFNEQHLAEYLPIEQTKGTEGGCAPNHACGRLGRASAATGAKWSAVTKDALAMLARWSFCKPARIATRRHNSMCAPTRVAVTTSSTQPWNRRSCEVVG